MEGHFRYLFHNFYLFMITLLSSLFMKCDWLSLIVFNFADASFSKTSENFFVNLKYELSADKYLLELTFDLIHISLKLL